MGVAFRCWLCITHVAKSRGSFSCQDPLSHIDQHRSTKLTRKKNTCEAKDLFGARSGAPLRPRSELLRQRRELLGRRQSVPVESRHFTKIFRPLVMKLAKITPKVPQLSGHHARTTHQSRSRVAFLLQGPGFSTDFPALAVLL